jgi:hypothetical protein
VFFRMGCGASDRSSLLGVIHEFMPADFWPRVLATFPYFEIALARFSISRQR